MFSLPFLTPPLLLLTLICLPPTTLAFGPLDSCYDTTRCTQVGQFWNQHACISQQVPKSIALNISLTRYICLKNAQFQRFLNTNDIIRRNATVLVWNVWLMKKQVKNELFEIYSRTVFLLDLFHFNNCCNEMKPCDGLWSKTIVRCPSKLKRALRSLWRSILGTMSTDLADISVEKI